MMVIAASVVIIASTIPFAGRLMATIRGNPFSDALPDWAQESVLELNRQGVIKGYENGRFGPGDPLTSGQTVTLLWRMLAHEHFLEKPERCAQRYDDIPSSHYAFVPLCVFRAQGWTTSDTRFQPDAPETRAGVVNLLSTVLGPTLRTVLTDFSANRQNFGDVPPGHPLAETTALLKAAGIFTGNPDGSAGLEAPLNRAAVAVLLYRTLTRLHDLGIRELQGVDVHALYRPDEPQFSLDLHSNILPAGVRQADISFAQSQTTDGLPDGMKPMAMFTLKPDGLKLKKPARFSVTLPIKDGSIPVPLHVSGSVAELVPELEARQNSAQHTVTFTGLLSHFSAFVFTIGGNLIDADAPDTVGPFRVGDSFSVPVTITNLEGDGRFVAEHVRISPPPVGKNGPFVQTSSFRTGGYSVTPDHIWNIPPPDTAMTGKTATYQGTFTCVRPGGDFVIYEADVNVDYSYDPKGWFAGMGNGGSMLAQVSTMTQVECRGPHIADWLKDVSIQTQCGGNVTIDGKLTDHPEDVQSVTVAFTRLVKGNWGGVPGGGNASFDAGTGRFHWAADLEPGYYGYQATVTLKNGISYLLHSSQFEITPCGEQPPIRIPLGDSSDTGIPIPLDSWRASSSSSESWQIDINFRSAALSPECERNIRECTDLERQCDTLFSDLQAAKKSCGQKERICTDKILDLTDEWGSCTKRYALCTKRNKYIECLRDPATTGAASSASSQAVELVSPLFSRSSAQSSSSRSSSASFSSVSSPLSTTLPRSSSSASSASSVRRFVCCEFCPATDQTRFYIPFAGDGCQSGDAQRDDLSEKTCANPLMENPGALPVTFGPACSAKPVGSFEFLDIAGGWKTVNDLPFGGSVHFIVASNGTHDVRKDLPIRIHMWVNDVLTYSLTFNGDPSAVCRNATGCSVDGPVIPAEWRGQTVRVEAYSKDGTLLSRFTHRP
ncbi:MAG: S-layer homology domain-containing protein [Candidatus Peribacteraceae bacterium]